MKALLVKSGIEKHIETIGRPLHAFATAERKAPQVATFWRIRSNRRVPKTVSSACPEGGGVMAIAGRLPGARRKLDTTVQPCRNSTVLYTRESMRPAGGQAEFQK